jgi:hypothetical protein
MQYDNMTKQQIAKSEIENARERLAELQSQAMNDNAAKAMHDIYKAYRNAGFSKKQAWKITFMLMKKTN